MAGDYYVDKVLGEGWTTDFAKKVGSVIGEMRARYAKPNALSISQQASNDVAR